MPSSARKIAAARATEAGKQISSINPPPLTGASHARPASNRDSKALSGDNSSLSLLNRYQARLHREYQRILKTLLEMQTGHLKAAHNVKLQNEPNPEFEHFAADSAHPHSDF